MKLAPIKTGAKRGLGDLKRKCSDSILKCIFFVGNILLGVTSCHFCILV